MKFTTISLSIALIAVPTVAYAQQDGEKGKPAGRRNEMQRPNGQPGGPGGQAGFGGMAPGQGIAMMAKMFPIMIALDLDQDGVLSASEIENASKSLIKLDKDGDGRLSAEELRPDPSKMQGMMAAMGGAGGPDGPMGQRTPAMMMKMFEARDTNRDGKLSGDEIPEPMRERLTMIDKDGDGAIQKSELEAANAIMAERTGKGPGRGNTSDGSGVKPKRPGQ